VSRRGRAIAFGCAALACAGLAAAVAGGYSADVESQLGPLRPVLVARADLLPRRALREVDAARALEIRRIPQRFAPARALVAPEQAIGRAPAVRIPAGSYVLATELTFPRKRPRRHRSSRLGPGREPVQIAVTGAEALAAAGRDPVGTRVDVVVTTEPRPGDANGRTYVAARSAELLALERSREGGLPGPASGDWKATLAVDRIHALRLIQAENFARQVRLIPR
jgi:Flp pilus assembly protein CpaB